MSKRGLTPVLGLVLLVGITAIASMALFVVGISLADATQSSAEHEQAEQSLAQLAQSGDRIAAGESTRSSFDILGTDSGTVRVVSDTGTLNVTVTNRTNDERLLTMEQSLGAIVYEASDGTEIAYQGGGVWRKDPTGGSTLVRSPEFHYRADPDPTITFPVVLVDDDFTNSGDTSGDLVAQESETIYPERPKHLNPLRDGSVRITIDSEYCEGWEEYFRGRTDGSAAEGCDAGEEGELEIQFSVPFELDGLEGGVMVGGGPSNFDHEDVNQSDIADSNEVPSATPLVEAKLEEAEQSGEILPADEDTIHGPSPGDDGARLYYDDGNLEGGDLTFNTTGGDITVVSDQSLVLSGDENLTVRGDGNVTIYANGRVFESGGGGGEVGTVGKESQLRIFVHSDVEAIGGKSNGNGGGGGQNTDLHGLLYAPNSDVTLGTGGGHNISGAIVGETVNIKNAEVNLSPELRDIRFYETIGDAPFYYLHMSETRISVDED